MNLNYGSKINLLSILLLYIVWPFAALVQGLKNPQDSYFKNVLWVYVIFYGYAFSYLETIDASAYRMLFELSASGSLAVRSFKDVFDSSITGQVDFIRPLINYLLTNFTDNYHILFAIYGVIFGFFYSRNVSFLMNCFSSKDYRPFFVILAFFAVYIGFWQINGFRFWTASQLLFYSITRIIFTKVKVKNYVLLMLTPCLHFSYVLPVVLFLFHRIVNAKRRIVIYLLFGLTLFNPFDNIAFFQKALKSYTVNDQLDTKIDSYTSEEAVAKANASSFLSKNYKYFGILFIDGILLFLALKIIVDIKSYPIELLHFLNYSILLTLVGSLLSFVPSLGRFSFLGYYFILGSVLISISQKFLFWHKYSLKIKIYGLVSIFILFSLNYWVFFTFSFHSLFGNFFTAVFDTTDVYYSLGNLVMEVFK